MKVSATWAARREGNNGFVLEIRPDGSRKEFGPMPPHIVPAFIEGRRRVIASLMKQVGASYAEPTEDYSYMQDTKH